MSERVLITGGAGFIGSHLADELLAAGYRVRVLDNLDPQVHGPNAERPAYLADEVELQRGDVRDAEAVRRALAGCDGVFHFAAAVGVGQSMYEIAHYTGVNNLGTAVLLEALAKAPVGRLIVASSMSVYGEGRYLGPTDEVHDAVRRRREDLQAGRFEPAGEAGAVLRPVPTPETKRPDLGSVYALSKYDQERLGLMIGEAYDIPTSAMRFFNVYGTRQALSNPYTGVLAIFASRLLNDNAPLVFEDGRQRRDFVSVRDVARACRAAYERPDTAGEVFNIGSGQSYGIDQIAAAVATAVGKPQIEAEVTGRYRVGDIRHCFADIGKARRLLDYHPQVTLEQGLAELADWLATQQAEDRVETAREELATRGLTL